MIIVRSMKSAVAIAALLALASTTHSQQSGHARPDPMGEFDCVIEAKMMIKLGSPDTGIVEEVKVDRDRAIKKGEILAQLDSELQRITVELAEVKAGNDMDIKSEQ